MPAPGFELLTDGHHFLEAPRWHQGRLWLSDFYAHRVLRVDLQGAVETVAEVAGQPSGLGFLPDGRMLVVSMKERRVYRQEADGRLVTHADLSTLTAGHCNDMVVDHRGHAWVGNFGFDLMAGAPPQGAALVHVAPDGTASMASEPLYFPNGMAITPDGSTLIVNETTGNRVSAFQMGTEGRLGPRQDWAVFAPLPTAEDFNGVLGQLVIAPDGCALDAEGALWVADAIGQRLVRVKAGQGIVETRSTAPLGAFACALGGPDGRTLFACVAPDFYEHVRSTVREAAIWTTTVAVPAAVMSQ